MISSHTPRTLSLSAALLLASLLSPADCSAWSLVEQPVEGILVLRNGNILRGKVQQQGDQYHVFVPNGQLQVRASQVETFCQNIEQAYQHRRETRGGSSADSHLEMAGWCLRHDLFAHAEAELQAARTTDPGHPRLGLLERQLRQSRRLAQREKRQFAKSNAPTLPVTPLDPATLEKAPPWARALFVRQIQPLVVHSCATSGCHQSDASEKFHLNRLALDGVGHPEATLRNLAATLEQIDWDTAAESALLRRARQAHGAATASTPLPAHKLRVLQGWIEQLAEAHRNESDIKMLPPVVEIAAFPLGHKLALNPPRQALPDSPKSITQPTGQIRQASFESADPFDPAPFNRRYATPEPPTPEPTTQSATQPPVLPVSPPSTLPLDENSVPHVLAPGEPPLTPATVPE